MEFFFGPSVAGGSGRRQGQQAASVRAEERAVARKSKAAASSSSGNSNGGSSSSSKKHDRPRVHSHKRPRAAESADSSAKDADDDERISRPAAKRLAKSSAMSARDAGIVNANREHVGSLPGTPRPRREALASRRSPPLRPAKKEALSPRAPRPATAADAAERRSGTASKRSPAKGSSGSSSGGKAAAPPQEPSVAREASAEPEGKAAAADEPAAAAIVSSVDAVRQSETQYAEYFAWATAEHPEHVALHLPGGGRSEPELYSLLMPRAYDREAEARDEYLPVNDLLATVRAIAGSLVPSAAFRAHVIDDQESGIVRRLERARNRRNGDDFVAAVADFNRMLDAEIARGGQLASGGREAPADVAIHVIEQTYNRVVAPTVGLLRQYKAFSNNVYGEILPTLVSELIGRTGITAESTFADLGCGIGNVVLQVAAQTGCRAHGIEIMEVPARFAQRQAREFAHRMRLYGLRHGAVSMLRGDFCESADVHRILPQVDVLLVNNYAFDSALNQNLLQMFLDLKEGTRIISLKPFVTPDYKISARNVYAPESILSVRRFPYWSQCVSWTDSGGEYFVQTVDRSGVKKFLSRGNISL
ncbi:Nucleosomal histone H3-Lys79 methylase [Coemansia erecta]|uniref:Histone-lysine N-methyltransferase, H3 lysine-79 specific n=1 Tax=Coemansia erecta TaxID=147472 RepID=A0A9W8CR50_9FUNG|nr:Nucleosomal histone H3-Lys79 methylase [Coemansia erecta]